MVHPYPLKLFVVIVALIIFNGFDPVFAQKPDISYPTPQNYTTNTPIAPLSLQNKGGNVPATTYSQVTTVAGNNKTIGSIDGTGSAASFVEPDGMAVDAAGNIYLVEVASSVVRKVTPQGVVTTFAGAGLPGNANGQGVAARFNNPKGIAIDAAGNFYVTDYTNGLIRKITPSGLVSTFAGSGAGGSKDGLGTAATFQRPTGIAIDAAGYIYVTEETNIIRRISPTGQVDRWAGSGVAGSADGTYTQASFNDPAGIAIDAVGNLYVTDRGNKLIRRITPGQVVTTIAGNGNFGATNGPALSASFSYPTGIAIDASGTIYIADWGSNLVRKLSPEGIVSTYAGNGTFAPADGIGTAAAFNLPAGVVIDSQGHLYVSEYNNNLIRFGVITGYIIDKPLPPGLVFDPTNGAITGTPTSAWPSTDYTITGYNASGSSSFVVNITVHDAAPAVQPPNITYQTPQNYTTNTPIGPLSPSNSGGAVVGIAGQVTTFAGDGTTTATDGTGTGASFSGPQLLRFDPASGNFYVVDAPNLIRKITPAGAVTTFATNFGKIQGLAIDASGSLFIADVDNNVIWKMTPGGTVTKYAGGAKGMTNGNLATAQFDGIFGLAFDSKGNLFVSDYNNRLIRKIDPGGNVTTFAGTLGVSASIDGTGTNAQFTAPDALTVDKNDNLWVADDNTLIRRVTSQGVVSTTAGNGSNLGTAQGTAAKFNGVFDLAADPAGNIYVVDNYYGLVKKITPSGLVTLVAGATPQGYNDGPLQSSHFSGALGIAFDSQGRLFITDRNNYRIREIGLSGYIIDKPMPPGLIFDQQTGIISGTPTAASPSTDYTITAFNAGGSSSFTVNITVSDPLSGLQPPNITYQTPKVYKVRKTITPLAPDNTGGAVPADAYGVSTFAGSTGSNGTFSAPYGLRTDGSGNLYVSDASQRIMKITPDGVLTVIAGSKDVTGSTNGQGTQALFNSPGQIATDLQGNIYVADINNNKIRKITPAGLVSTFAGTGATGSLNGASTTATFFHPTGVTVDAAGNVYVADHDNNVIRKITPNGTVSTFAGLAGSPGANNGNGTSARFSGPTYLAADALGNIYVADNNNQMVRKISPSGDVTTLAGNGSVGFNNGAGINATFKGLGGLTTDIYGNVYVVDKGNYVVRKITPGGVVSTFAGSGVKGAVNGDPLTAKFAGSTDITIDDEGNLYLADGGQVRKIITGGYTIDKPLPLGLNFDATTGVISGTPAAASPATDYVITAYNLSGSSSFIIRITVDPADANIIQPPNISYITPQVYTATKIIGPLIPANTGGAVPTTVYGQVSTFAGSGTPGAADGLGKAASFSYPIAIALDPAGNFYVTETVNSLLRQITPGAAVSTFAGKAGKTGYADGQGAAALFASPNGVAVDGAGN
ncbi:MAG TPA: putative Ig domain-containing protein, partial [Mucilaginibacter sp.]|nr:putative Ig domain-containing protein [Mucilaginibacter sp.]